MFNVFSQAHIKLQNAGRTPAQTDNCKENIRRWC